MVCTLESGNNFATGTPEYIVAEYDRATFTEAVLPEIQKEGYHFNGWYTRFNDETGDIVQLTKVTKDDFKDNPIIYVRGDYRQYAEVGSWNSYQFIANGGTLYGDETACFISPAVNFQSGREHGYLLSRFVPEREGYKFIGWNTKQDGSGIYYTETKQDTPYYVWEMEEQGEEFERNGESIVLYAQWGQAGVTGDVNDDGVADIADALMISRYDAGLIELDDTQKSLGDVNKDGETDIADALLISRYDAGLIDSLE